jgi:hypothetical protein
MVLRSLPCVTVKPVQYAAVVVMGLPFLGGILQP